MRHLDRAGAVGVLIVVGGCAAAEKSAPKAPSADASASTGQAGYPAQPGAYPQTQAQPQPQAGMPAPEATFAKPPPSPEARVAGEELEKGRRELEAAGGRCQDACKALSSMDRAAGRICNLETGYRCDDAKQKVYSARDRVRASCGTCSDGTTTERDAPVPSR